MSMHRNFYYGPYMKIWLPSVPSTKHQRICPNGGCTNHFKYVQTPFCPLCGHMIEDETVQVLCRMSLHDFFEKEFNDIDLFIVIHPDNEDYTIALSNQTSIQGGRHFEYSDSSEILTFSEESIQQLKSFFNQEDWVKFEESLKKNDIRYEKKTGIIQWIS